MFAAQRIALIKELLLERKSVDTNTLCSYLGVSDVTVRKYLDKLEQENFLIKKHGGAVLAPNYMESFDYTEMNNQSNKIENFSQKEQIAELAASLIEEGDKIFLGQGTTCYVLSKLLHKFKNISVVTNNVNCISELAAFVSQLFFIGGDVFIDGGTIYTHGNKALTLINGIYVSKAFFSVEGIDLNAGLTLKHSSETEIIQKVSSISNETIILADSSKFDKFGLHRLCPIDEYRIYVTDNNIKEQYKKFFYNHDIKLLTAYSI